MKDDLPQLDEKTSVPLYRIAQQALLNALTHSEATRITVELGTARGNITLSVKDDGRGFVIEAAGKTSLGISGMKERMQRVGGTLTIVSNPGQGTEVMATLPLG